MASGVRFAVAVRLCTPGERPAGLVRSERYVVLLGRPGRAAALALDLVEQFREFAGFLSLFTQQIAAFSKILADVKQLPWEVVRPITPLLLEPLWLTALAVVVPVGPSMSTQSPLRRAKRPEPLWCTVASRIGLSSFSPSSTGRMLKLSSPAFAGSWAPRTAAMVASRST